MRIIQQRFTLKLTADLMGKAVGRSIPLAEAERWTIEEYAHVHYQASCHSSSESDQWFMLQSDLILRLSESCKAGMERRQARSLCVSVLDYSGFLDSWWLRVQEIL